MKQLVFFVAMGFALAACGGNIYGESTRYPRDVSDPVEVVMPANALSISAQFFDPQSLDGNWHAGMNILGERGSPVLAAAPGRVIASYFEPFYGRRVHIDHGLDENGRRVVTRYFHLQERLVKVGDTVKRGEIIARMGSSGLLGATVHVHFEVQRGVRDNKDLDAYDPQLFWVDGVGRVTCFDGDATYPDLPFRTTYPTPCR